MRAKKVNYNNILICILNAILLLYITREIKGGFHEKLILGIGFWGWGIGPNPQSPIPNPQIRIRSINNTIINTL